MAGRDYRVAFGDARIEECLLIAPHGGGIEPGTSEILRAVADLGGWAWYEFAGFLKRGNKESLHIASVAFDEPTLLSLMPRTAFVLAIHGTGEDGQAVVYVGGRWKAGRELVTNSINGATPHHGIHALDATEVESAKHLCGLDDASVTNRGRLGEGVQVEFSRTARDLLFPPNASREARGRRSSRLRSLARCLHHAVVRLCPLASEQLRKR